MKKYDLSNIEGDCTLIIIKPDAIQKKLLGEIESRLKSQKLSITERTTVHFDLAKVQMLYQWPAVIHPVELSEYLCKSPLPVWLISGPNAIEKVYFLKVGMRKEFGADELHNLFHCCDSEQDFHHEYQLLFANQPLVSETSPNPRVYPSKNQRRVKTNKQIEVYVFKKLSDKQNLFLLLKRTFEKGGFWQPVTGNVQENESFEHAAQREVREETGIRKMLRIFDTGYSFDFFDDERWQHEKVFGAEVSVNAAIKLSHEHTEFRWVTAKEALLSYLKWPGNKEGLRRLSTLLGISYE